MSLNLSGRNPPLDLRWAILEPFWGYLRAILGRSWSHLGPSWAVLGPSWCEVGNSPGYGSAYSPDGLGPSPSKVCADMLLGATW